MSDILIQFPGRSQGGALTTGGHGAGAGDPFWDFVVFLSEFNGPVGVPPTDPSFIEDSSRHHTFNWDFANPGIGFSDAQSEYGNTSGTSFNSFRMGTSPTSNDWNLSSTNTDAFTIEYSYYQVELAGTYNVLSMSGPFLGTFGWICRHQLDQIIWFWSSDGSSFQNVSSPVATIDANVWIKWCYEKDTTGKIRLYKNGSMFASSTPADSTIFHAGQTLDFNNPAATFSAWMGNVRITKGIARYASDAGYTPATAPFPIGPV